MFQPTESRHPRPRRFWLAEVLLVAGILAFGGFTLLTDARVSPAQWLSGFSDIVGR